jgi:anthranilate synthase component I
MNKIISEIKLLSKPQFIKISDDVNFFETFRNIENKSKQCFLFESLGEHRSAQRYSVIGFEPDAVITARGKKIICNGQTFEVENPYYFLRNLIPSQIASSQHFIGGLVGYLAYDAVNYFEPSLQVKTHPDFDQFNFGLYTDGLLYDNLTGELTYFYYYRNRIDVVKKILQQKPKKLSLKTKFIKDDLSPDEHSACVNRILAEIKLGNTFQSQLGFKRHYHLRGDHLAVYQKLRKTNPSPYMFYLKNKAETLLGASPELLFKLQQNHMETFPLAGTVRRERDEKADKLLAKKLLNDPKEIAEHNMLVDLHRNDIGRVAEFGSVRIQKLKDVKKFSHVQHISSEVVGTLRKSEDMFSALASNFPAGTLSGAPKIESIKIIDRLEKEPRGPYGGAVGYFGFDGNCSFCIPIRSLFISENKGFIQASGGIVYDSKAKVEYQEIQDKLKALDQVLDSFKEKL